MRRRLAKSIFHWLMLGIFAANVGLAPHCTSSSVIATACFSGSDDPARGLAVSQAEDCHDAATCPICQFLAQGQVVGPQVAVESVYLSVPRPSLAVPLVSPVPGSSTFQRPGAPCGLARFSDMALLVRACTSVPLFR